jgi:hypothetical protein
MQLVSSRGFGQKVTLINQLIEYMKIHMISLEQDWQLARDGAPLKDDEYDPSDDYFEGAIDAVGHLLSVATDIMNDSNERYINE